MIDRLFNISLPPAFSAASGSSHAAPSAASRTTFLHSSPEGRRALLTLAASFALLSSGGILATSAYLLIIFLNLASALERRRKRIRSENTRRRFSENGRKGRVGNQRRNSARSCWRQHALISSSGKTAAKIAFCFISHASSSTLACGSHATSHTHLARLQRNAFGVTSAALAPRPLWRLASSALCSCGGVPSSSAALALWRR